MKETKTDIIDNIARKGEGMTVPEGYFEDFAVKMATRLPFREELDTPLAQQKPKNSTWLKFRPYVYLAAMFAGAWCLLKMFSLMSTTTDALNIENYPSLSNAIENEQFINDYIIDDISSYDLYDYDMLDSDRETGEDFINNTDEQYVYSENDVPHQSSEDYLLPNAPY